MGLCTIIGKVDRDASGKSIGQPMMSTIYRMRKLDRTIIGNSEANSNFGIIFPKLDKYKDSSGRVRRRSRDGGVHLQKGMEERGCPGQTTNTIRCGGAVYRVQTYHAALRTMKEVAQAANISLKKFQKSYNRFVLDMDMKVPRTDTIQCVARIASNANITEKYKATRNRYSQQDHWIMLRWLAESQYRLQRHGVIPVMRKELAKTRPWEDIADAAGCGSAQP